MKDIILYSFFHCVVCRIWYQSYCFITLCFFLFSFCFKDLFKIYYSQAILYIHIMYFGHPHPPLPSLIPPHIESLLPNVSLLVPCLLVLDFLVGFLLLLISFFSLLILISVACLNPGRAWFTRARTACQW